ncbi:MAG TPA: cyclase family protein [candidate division Zixibacteria bacterium]|nr:cyclase family protein [candidate division Zixibacteria bacterium]MDD4918222.1 cyclase family protein [candidate division Zixibacteria bacterium]MDM7971602.1 cyclase family protein [candidate division Zixibacteria bacterium]HOD66445.1 cyclase family protein [candidate division Zixibacteria bacterium]HOZ07976.1 cyclase family protein [candidate division Zixibacteria bacterium]
MASLIDISQPLVAGMAVWPGDAPFRPFWTARLAETGSVNIGGVTMSLHTGTHLDAPKHFRDSGSPVADLSLDPCVGEAVVFDLASARGPLDTEAILPELLASLKDNFAPRVLLKTGTGGDGRTFPGSFSHLTLPAACFLADLGVRLIGVDTPSVDRVDSRDMGVHHLLADRGIVILEGLVLRHVVPGRYELIALPLKFADMDASPVRAVLRTLD